MGILKLGVNQVSNQEYHSDKSFFSSSSFKKLLDCPATFHKEEILGQREDDEGPKAHFEEGSLLHTLVLEPHLVAKEYAVFQGMRRSGQHYEQFRVDNPGKTIITMAQMERAKHMHRSFLQNESAVKLIQGGLPEHTVCVMLEDIPVKVRADYINIEQGYIADLKSSSFPVDIDSVRMTIDKWQYGLSAALYCQVMEAYYGRKFDFYWPFICKTEPDCGVYRMSSATREKGERKFMEAFRLYKECLRTGIWESKLKPSHFMEEIQEV